MNGTCKKFRQRVYFVTVGLSLILGTVCMAQGIPPSAVTLWASGTNGDALLNGIVNPNGSPTMAWFEWGATTGYTNATELIDVGSGTSNLPLDTVITGLTAGVVYQYRVVASNSVGLMTGQQDIFQSPRIVLNGDNPMTNECHMPFNDPGAVSMAAPLAISGGADHSLALKTDGTVAAWGENSYQEVPAPLGLSNVVAVAAGGAHSLALKNDGMIVGWGRGYEGQTAPPSDLNDVVAIAAGYYYSLALKGDGVVVGFGDNNYGETNVPVGLSNVVAIAAGSFHALALNNNGKVVGWGYNADGEIDIPTDLSNVVAVSAGWNQSLALKNDGTVVGWGQTSIPPGLSNIVAISAGLFHNLALKSDGTVTGWGSDYYGQVSGLENLTNVIAIAAGGYHSLAVTGNGTLVAVGYNLYGQTNVPSNLGGEIIESGFVDYNNPATYTLIYTASNSLGGASMATRTVVVVDTTPPSLTLLGANPLVMPVNTTFVDPGATAMDACAGDLTGSIFVTGNVNNTVLGTNTLTYTVTDYSGNTTITNRTVIAVVGAPFVTTLTASGTNQSATLSGTVNANGGSTKAWFEWGTNILHGNVTAPISVGNGLTNATLNSSLTGLTPGILYHYRIVATNSAGRSNGRDVIIQNLPAIVQAPAVMLSGINPFTNECHSPFIDPGAVVIAPLSAIAAGEYYSLALKKDGTVAAWGNTPDVPPGLNDVKAVAAGYISSLALKTDGTVVGWGDNTFGETNTPAGLSNVVAISSGYGYSLALKADGTLAGWGENNFTPTTIPSGLSNVVAIAAGFDLCLAAKEDGTVVGWGHPSFGGTTPPSGLSNVVAVAAGESYGLALKSDGTVVGWGTTVPVGLSNVVAIAAGFDFSLALKSDGTVVGWGDDFYGEATPPSNLKNVVAIAAGAYHSLALRSDGTVVGWGMGFYGETDITTSGTNLVTSLPAAGFVNANDPGKYTLIYKATNSAGKVASVTRTVVVVDTTPPNIDCPTNLTLEFTTERGAVVSFAPKATDLCSTFAYVKCVPASGTWFPIGTTTVLVKATDSSGNSAFCNFQVTVLGAQGVISNLVSELIALRNNVNYQPDYVGLSGAISNLQQSLAPALWIDQTHLDKTSGGMVFTKDIAAVQSLLKLMKDKHGTISNVVLLGSIKRLVKADYLLALVSINDVTKARKSPLNLNGAMEALVRGDEEAVRAQYGAAIGYYQNAWNLATRLIIPHVK